MEPFFINHVLNSTLDAARLVSTKISKSQKLRNSATQRLSVLATWCLKKSHVVTTVSRQAVECEARNPCIRDRNVIKVLKARQRYFLSHLRRFDFFAILFCRDSALRASSPAYILSSLQDFFAMSNKHRALSISAHSSWLTAHGLLFLNEAFYSFTVFCNDFNEVNTTIQVCYVND